MKLKKFFMTAIVASMALVSCDKSESDMSVKDSALKSVTVKLANVQTRTASRSKDNAVLQDESTAKLSKFTIFFVDANGGFHEGYAADDVEKKNAVLDRTFTVSEDEKTTIPTYHYIDASVTKVIVVGNPTWTTEPANESALKALTVSIENQQDVDNLVLIGETALVKENTSDDAGHTNNYKADVNILPLVARLEVAAFRYNALIDEESGEEIPRLYTSLTLNKLAVNNYYGTCSYSKNTTDLQNATISNSTVWNVLDALATDAWHNDANMSITLNGAASYTHDVDIATEQVYAYNVFATQVPQLILGMSGTKSDESTSALYLATKGLGVASFQAGHIYRMDIDKEASTPIDKPFEFDDDDLQNPDKCVDVTVTVTPWTVVYVTPEF